MTILKTFINKYYVLYNKKYEGYLGKDSMVINLPDAEHYGNVRMAQLILNKRKDKREWEIKKTMVIHREDI